MSLTLTELRTAARIDLADPKGNSDYWDTDSLDQGINNALKTLWGLLIRLKAKDVLRNYKDLKTTNITNVTTYYTLDDDFFLMDKVYLYGIPARLIDYSEKDVLADHSFLKPTNAQPGYYLKEGYVWPLPVPTANYTNGLDQYFYKKPPVLSDSVATVSIADKFKPIIVKLAVGECKALKESVADGVKITQMAIKELQILLGSKIILESEQKKTKERE